MDNASWFLLVGALLLSMGFTTPLMRRLPVTTAMIYLAAGIVVGPMGLSLFHFNPLKESALLELLTEGAVLISLYAAGVKMPAPVTLARWRAPLQLAFVSMAITVALVAAFAHLVLAMPLGVAVLLGAIVAPTDPVLATEVQVRHPEDRDQFRFALTCEAGINDGSAFPFVMLGLGLMGLHELGDNGLQWILRDVLWATVAAVAIGVVAGRLVAWTAVTLRNRVEGIQLADDFLGLGLLGVAYGVSVMVSAWGFLAVFAAAVTLRQTELKLGGLFAASDGDQGAPVSEGSLIFKEHLERLSEVLLILLIGGSLFMDSWSWRAVVFALFLFTVARPLSVLVGLVGTRTRWRLRGMVAWFGVRGIGSLYYLMYAIEHGLPEEYALELIHFTLVVVTLSIVMHGGSVKPLMARFWSGKRKRRNRR